MHAKQKFKNYANPTNLANFSTFLVLLFLFRPSLHHHIVAVVALTILALVAQTGEHNTQLHARGCILVHGGVRLSDDVQDRIGAQVRSELILARQTEAGLHHGRQIQAVLELAVGLLQHQRLLVGEPVALAPLQLSTQLGVELLVLDGCHIVDDLAFLHLDAQVAAAAGGVVQGVTVIFSTMKSRAVTADSSLWVMRTVMGR